MIELLVPKLNANDENLWLVEKIKENNSYCKSGEPICIFETTKSTFEFDAPEDGYVYFIYSSGSRIKCGEIFAYMDNKKIDADSILPEDKANRKLIVTKKAAKLINKESIKAEDIKKSGVIKIKDVEQYLSSKSAK